METTNISLIYPEARELKKLVSSERAHPALENYLRQPNNIQHISVEKISDVITPEEHGKKRFVPILHRDSANPFLVPIRHERIWPVLTNFPSLTSQYRSVIYAAPLEWQLEQIVYQTCRAQKIPVAAGHARNMDVTAEMARQLAPSIIVIANNDVSTLEKALHSQTSFDGTMIVSVSMCGDRIEGLSTGFSQRIRVVELFPSYPIFFSCVQGRGGGLWHLSDEYAWTTDGEAASIIPLSVEVPWFCALTIPYHLEKKSPCACGKTLFAITPL